MDGIAYAKQYVIDHSKNTTHEYKLSSHTAGNSEAITITDTNGKTLGSITIEKAINSSFQAASQLSKKQLHNCAVLSTPVIEASENKNLLLPMLCYFALRQARIWKCQNVIFTNTENNSLANDAIRLMHLEPLSHCKTISINNETQIVYAQRIKYAIYHAYNACDDTTKPFVQSEFINEILTTFRHWVDEFFKDSLFSAVNTRTISKEQYITTLYNLHQFVRHTTRLAARCVACSNDRELRNHYIFHLKGEINHEIIIESDLSNLGADLDYLLSAHVAHTATSEFIVLQESTIGYKQDPVMMLACPFIAEGMTANISNEFIENLHATIKTWGVDQPESVSRFLTSHMKTDGGVDGHWLRVVMMTHKFVKDELSLQHYLNTMKLAMSAYAHGLNANIDDLELWRPEVATTKNEPVMA